MRCLHCTAEAPYPRNTCSKCLLLINRVYGTMAYFRLQKYPENVDINTLSEAITKRVPAGFEISVEDYVADGYIKIVAYWPRGGSCIYSGTSIIFETEPDTECRECSTPISSPHILCLTCWDLHTAADEHLVNVMSSEKAVDVELLSLQRKILRGLPEGFSVSLEDFTDQEYVMARVYTPNGNESTSYRRVVKKMVSTVSRPVQKPKKGEQLKMF